MLIPSSAFISKLEIGEADPRLEAAAQQRDDGLTSAIQSGFSKSLIGNEFSTFVLPILLGPRENATL